MLRKTLKCLVGMSLLLTGFAVAGEEANYKATYKGVFSLYEPIGIADVKLVLSDVEIDKSSTVKKISLWVSSENFSTIERLYPFRYLFNSYVKPDNGQTFAFEHIKTGKKQKQFVGLIGVQKDRVELFEKKPAGEILTPSETRALLNEPNVSEFQKRHQLKNADKPLTDLEKQPIDRLTLLEKVREQVRKREKSRDYFVTSGNKLMIYRVGTMVSSEWQNAGQKNKAIKVKIEAFKATATELGKPPENSVNVQEDENDIYLHAPVYAWFSADQQAVPYKFVNRHAIGEFIIELSGSLKKEPKLALRGK